MPGNWKSVLTITTVEHNDIHCSCWTIIRVSCEISPSDQDKTNTIINTIVEPLFEPSRRILVADTVRELARVQPCSKQNEVVMLRDSVISKPRPHSMTKRRIFVVTAQTKTRLYCDF